MSGDIAHPGPAAVADPGRVRRHRTWLVAGAAVVAVAIGAETILSAPAVESTDDAYTAADATNVAPKVRGLVGAILVRDNQTVHAGDPLVRIDAEEFDARVQSAQSDLLDAEAGIQAANAALASLDAEQRLAAANVEASRTSIRSSQADLERAAADRRRYEALVSTGAVAQHDVDVYRSAAVGAEQAALR
jgi:membrane fusion protein (multidrug efflux system)